MNGYREKHVLILGMGVSGQSAAQFLLNRQATVIGIDRNYHLLKSNERIAQLCQQGMVFQQEDSLVDVSLFDFVVVSPGIPISHSLYQQALELGIEVIGEVELACRSIKQKCLAVTGTNGKTTVTLMTAYVLQQAGIKVLALGNIGVPLTSAIDATKENQADVFVIELSSFQLDTLSHKFIDAAVILNITPDHLDRYPSMQEYALSKIGIEKNVKEDGVLFASECCLRDYGKFFAKKPLFYGYCPNHYLYIDKGNAYCKGKKIFTLPTNAKNHSHDAENILASYALCSTLSVPSETFFSAIASFQKPPHRIEFVRTVNGVHYYDDSKGTNIDAVMRAVERMNGQVILIAGGVDKGFPYTPWINAFAGKVRTICAIGQAKEKIKSDLSSVIPVIACSTMNHAVICATGIAKEGENVLLSPGCSSFDMFQDYAHRGREFQDLVKGLENLK